MANLLSRRPPPDPFPALTNDQRDRLQSRLAAVAALGAEARQSLTRRAQSELEAELDELESAPLLVTALELLDRLDGLRAGLDGSVSPVPRSDALVEGGLVLYRPGRSLETGEADVASRGYFDGLDRPPLAGWLEAVGRSHSTAPDGFELGLICWVAASDLARARAGCEACASSALTLLEESLEPLGRQLSGLLRSHG